MLHSGRYAMYLRKSRADLERERHGQFETLAKHERELTAFAKANGYPVDRVYKEIVSGESVAARVEFQRLMEEVRRREYAGVMVHAVDRLGRGDMMEYGWILSTFQYTGTLIITPGKAFDPSDQMDLQQLQLQMFFSNTELSYIKRRLVAGREQAVRDGQHIASRAPYGYDKATQGGNKTLKANGRAEVVAGMYRDIADGKSPSAVARRLNSSGVPSPKGGEWGPAVVRAVIENPVYKGMVAWNRCVTRVESRDGMDYVKKRARGDEPIVAKGLHEGIVDEGLWERANEAIRPSPRQKKGHELRNPLAGVLRCAKCGRAMRLAGVTAKGREYAYFRHPPYTSCGCEPSPYADVMGLAVEGLCAAAEDLAVSIEAGGGGGRGGELAALQGELRRMRHRADKLFELYAADAITVEEFRERKRPLDEQAAAAEARAAELEAYVPPDPVQVETSVRGLVAMLADETIPAAERNSALKAVVERMEYSREGGDLRLKAQLRGF